MAEAALRLGGGWWVVGGGMVDGGWWVWWTVARTADRRPIREVATRDSVLRVASGGPPLDLHDEFAGERPCPAAQDHQDARPFPTDEAAVKLLWLALRNITAKWERTAYYWRPAMNQFAMLYEGRFTPTV
jgi:hypothetical protein